MKLPSVTTLELLHAPGRPAADDGFRLEGHAASGSGRIRLLLRRTETWNRYLDPRIPPSQWDLRVMIRTDSAFALQQEFVLNDLKALATDWVWPVDHAGSLASLAPNGDLIHDTVLSWAVQVTAPPAAPAPEPEPAAAEPESEAVAE